MYWSWGSASASPAASASASASVSVARFKSNPITTNLMNFILVFLPLHVVVIFQIQILFRSTTTSIFVFCHSNFLMGAGFFCNFSNLKLATNFSSFETSQIERNLFCRFVAVAWCLFVCRRSNSFITLAWDENKSFSSWLLCKLSRLESFPFV